jgi:hypothetical protein
VFALLWILAVIKAIIIGSAFMEDFRTDDVYGITDVRVKWLLLFVFPVQGIFLSETKRPPDAYVGVLHSFKILELILIYLFFVISLIRVENKMMESNLDRESLD